jgi:hypothetical protein
LPESASHSLTVLSTEAVSNRRPSGLNATDHTSALWPDNVSKSLPESASENDE